MATSWTDHPTTSNTRIRAAHINELRTAVRNAGYSGAFTDDPVTTSTRIRAVHFLELRNAIQERAMAAGMGALPGWTKRSGTNPSANTPIYADDINDLRRWMSQLESKRYGVYSVAYDASSNVQITASWADDVKRLGVPYVRVLVESDPNTNDIESVLPTHLSTCLLYRNRGINPIAVLTRNTHRPDFPGVGDPNEPLDPVTHSNTYINGFALRAQRIAQALYSTGALSPVVNHFEIWNEPNDWAGGTSPNFHSDRFGSLLYFCADYIKHSQGGNPAVNPNAKIISGGLFYHDFLPGGWDEAFLTGGWDGDYEEVGLYNSDGAINWRNQWGGYPWDYLGIHPYHSLSGGLAGSALDNTRGVQTNPIYSDPSDIWVTEFGEMRNCASTECNDDASALQQANALDSWYNLN